MKVGRVWIVEDEVWESEGERENCSLTLFIPLVFFFFDCTICSLQQEPSREWFARQAATF